MDDTVERAGTDPAKINKRAVLLTTSLVSSLIMLDSNIVAVSLPAIGHNLKASFSDVQWVIGAYLLAYAALLLGTGAFADRYGRKRATVIGLVIFGAASAACGLAPTSWLLNAARALQGIGGSFLLTAALAILTHTFSGAERARAFAVWGACLGVALTLGPIVGGVITNYWGWRWIFLVNIPASVALVLAVLAYIPESRDEDAHGLDYAGIATLTPGLFFLVWALIDGNKDGWSSSSILGRIVLAAFFIVLFVRIERRQVRPMVDLSLFKRNDFLGAVLAMIGYGGTAQVMIFYLPLYLQSAFGYSPLQAGLGMLPFALPMVLVPRLAARFTTQSPTGTVLAVGLAVTTVGNGMFWWMAHAQFSYEAFVVAMLVAGAGAGLLNGETVKAIGAAVPPERAGMASGLASTTRFVGILVGVAVLGAALSHVARTTFERAFAGGGINATTLDRLAAQVPTGDVDLSLAPAALHPRVTATAHAAFSQGFGSATLIATFASLVACLLVARYLRAFRSEVSNGQSKEATAHCFPIDCRHPV